MQRIAWPRLPFSRFFSSRPGRRPSLLPTAARPTPIRITPSTSRGFRGYAPLRTESPSPSPPLPDENASLTTRLKVIMKSYGWYAVGVYFVLGAIDMTIAFAAINILGAEQVGKVTTYVKGAVSEILHGKQDPTVPSGDESKPVGVGSESLWAMIVLSYAVHKTLFLPLRAGLTLALTPRLVKWLNARGWGGSAGALRAAAQVKDRMRNKVNRD